MIDKRLTGGQVFDKWTGGILGLIVLAAILCATSCSGATPEPFRGPQCGTDNDVGETCWTCASEPVCVWCASGDPAVRGCYDRSQPIVCQNASVVRISDDCNVLEIGTDRR